MSRREWRGRCDLSEVVQGIPQHLPRRMAGEVERGPRRRRVVGQVLISQLLVSCAVYNQTIKQFLKKNQPVVVVVVVAAGAVVVVVVEALVVL